MSGLTDLEEEIFASLRDLRADEEAVPLTKIMELFDVKNRHAMSVRMKYLTAKLAPMGWIIRNEGGVGRGKKATYKMEKRF